MTRTLIGSLLIAVLLSGCTAVVNTQPLPPAPRVEVIPVAPGPEHVWVPGHWSWRAAHGEYVWVSGHWTVR